MQEIICYTNYLPEGTEQYITFLDLLLNDNLANGKIVCPSEVYGKIGNINTHLNAKQNYEFLLRAIKEYPVRVVGTSDYEETSEKTQAFKQIEDLGQIEVSETSLWEEFRTDCYVAGKYSKYLMDSGYFNPVVETLLGVISSLPDPDTGTKWLEKMLSHAPEFYEIDDDTQPILIYRGDSTCYNQLNVFADALAKALVDCDQRVEIFDVEKEGVQSLIKYKGQHFKAIIGIQTYLFSIKMQDKVTNLHDLIVGPKFNMILDHPVLLKDHIMAGPKDYYLLIHDRNYLNFAKKYYKNVKDCFFFSPAGVFFKQETDLDALVAAFSSDTEKIYDVSFIGTYYNYRNILSNIKNFDKDLRFIARRFLNEMRHTPNLPAETALTRVLEHCQMNLSDEEFFDLLFELRYVFFGVMYYYREKVIRTLLDAGIKINVYGSSWDSSLFAHHPCLIKHSQVTGDESLRVMRQSRISLNIMAWHKDGFTERIANSILNGSVVVSDTSTQLSELFENGEDLVLFDLNDLVTLPATIQKLLSSKEALARIAKQGYEKAYQNHLWLNRAQQLLDILTEIK